MFTDILGTFAKRGDPIEFSEGINDDRCIAIARRLGPDLGKWLIGSDELHYLPPRPTIVVN